MSYFSHPKSGAGHNDPRSDAMMESVLGGSQVYVRKQRDDLGNVYFALNTVQGETLATFAEREEANAAIVHCQLMAITLH